MNTEKATKSRMAYDRIRAMIVTREFSDEQVWSIRKLAAKLNVSVVPVTEAIRRLEQEGIIHVSPQRGIALRRLSVQQLRELAVVREGLEVQAARILARTADRATFAKLRRTAKRLQSLLKAGQCEKAAYEDFRLHRQLVEATACRFLIDQYDRLITVSMITTGAWDAAWARVEFSGPSNHVALVEAISAGDPEEADRAMRRHIRSTATGGEEWTRSEVAKSSHSQVARSRMRTAPKNADR